MNLPAPPGPIDWQRVFRLLTVGEQRGDSFWPGPQLKPWEVRRCTMAEIAAMLSADAPPPGGGMGMADLADYARWFHGLSATERVRLAREGRL